MKQCSFYKWNDHANPVKASDPISYGFGPGTDCVTEAAHYCNSVPQCQAIGLGQPSSSTVLPIVRNSYSFVIELYSCLNSLGAEKGWSVYRKQDGYSAPFEQRRGDQTACPTTSALLKSFVCEQVPYEEGANVTLAMCDSTIPSQKWKLEDVSKKSVSKKSAGRSLANTNAHTDFALDMDTDKDTNTNSAEFSEHGLNASGVPTLDLGGLGDVGEGGAWQADTTTSVGGPVDPVSQRLLFNGF
jgi:hypothetical protein